MFAQSKGGSYSLTNGASDVADAIDFDGVTDYLSRSSDLVGNADGKTFTFSAWVWAGLNAGVMYASDPTNNRFAIYYGTGLSVVGKNSSNAVILNASVASIPRNTFLHIIVSIDLANTANRGIYINDVAASVTWTTYSNDTIDFTNTSHQIPANGDKRLSHVFLAYEYIDLSVEANRRIFITADRKATSNANTLWASAGHTSAIMYLPLNDPTQPGKNLGTGGDFTLNGVVARSGRGPSQFNAPYSDLDGSADYLSRTTALSGAVDGKQATFSCVFNLDVLASDIFFIGTNLTDGAGIRFFARISDSAGNPLQIYGRDSSGATVVFASSASNLFVIGRNYQVVMSFDSSDTNKRAVYLNGSPISVTWSTYVTTTNIQFNSQYSRVGEWVSDGSNMLNGRLGNVFFDTKYIDLSQPANLAKFVTGTGIDAKPADLGANGEKPFGTPPLIYLPMYGNNAGKNYGTGGDFTVNSGPFPGARGPNEFWGNKADFNGITGYLSRTSALNGVSDGKTFSCSFWVVPDAISTQDMLFTIRKVSGVTLTIQASTSTGRLNVSARNSDNVTILSGYSSIFGTDSDRGRFVNISIDLTDAAKRFIYVNGVNTCTWLTYTNDSIFLSAESVLIGNDGGADYLDGKLSEFYFTTEYIDFSQESNRLKFRDAFGNPVDLAPQIAAGTLPNPAIYMRFDPANFGKNSGAGGDFTVSGTITDGGQL